MSGVDPSKIHAILFDLHHTITKTRIDIVAMFRKTAENAGIDLSPFSDEKLGEIFAKTDGLMKTYLIENDVDIHWGNDPKDWLELNRNIMNHLGFSNMSDEQIMKFEMGWRETGDDSFEILVDDAKETLEELHKRGYTLGVCTRRQVNPEQLLTEWGLRHLFSTIQFTGSPGYAKPNPFTLLKAAEEIGVNPRLCAYVGNYVGADVGAAISAEMLPILTVWSDPKEKELAPETAIVIDKINELLNLFEGPPN